MSAQCAGDSPRWAIDAELGVSPVVTFSPASRSWCLGISTTTHYAIHLPLRSLNPRRTHNGGAAVSRYVSLSVIPCSLSFRSTNPSTASCGTLRSVAPTESCRIRILLLDPGGDAAHVATRKNLHLPRRDFVAFLRLLRIVINPSKPEAFGQRHGGVWIRGELEVPTHFVRTICHLGA
jgi:hypothetical protein